ncbi:unnamed protein product, partial [Iphiclides podalirius]
MVGPQIRPGIAQVEKSCVCVRCGARSVCGAAPGHAPSVGAALEGVLEKHKPRKVAKRNNLHFIHMHKHEVINICDRHEPRRKLCLVTSPLAQRCLVCTVPPTYLINY